MMKKIRKFLLIIYPHLSLYLLILFFGALTECTVFFSLYLINSSDQNPINIGFQAFAGALFAFMFVRIGDALTKYYEKQRNHYNALVGLEIHLDEIGGVINDDIYLLPDFRRTICSGNISANNIKTISLRKDFYERLQDIELINDLYKLNYDIRRINDDIDSAMQWYSKLRDLYTEAKISLELYKTNVAILSDNLKLIQAALSQLLEKSIKINATVKIRFKYDIPLLTRIFQYIDKFTHVETDNKEIENKMREIQNELIDTKLKSNTGIIELIKIAQAIQD